jgi:hypothetical protein
LGIVDRVIANGSFDINMLQHDETGATKEMPRRHVPTAAIDRAGAGRPAFARGLSTPDRHLRRGALADRFVGLGVSNELMNAAITARDMVFSRDEKTMQFGFGYRHGSLSQDTRPDSEGLRVGDRAPDAPGLLGVGKSTRIFDLLRGPHITLPGFGVRWRSVIDDCVAVFGDGLLGYVISASCDDMANIADEHGHACAAYGTRRCS